jgi:uncharacterized tellurite resistance protein B-like protein
MFASLKTLIPGLVGEAKRRDRFAEDDCRVATAALLIRAASVEGDMSEARRDKLHTTLKSYFGCDDAATGELIEAAAKAACNAIDLYHFTRRISLLVNDERRHRIVQMMWEVIYADGSESPIENNIVWRAADLLGVPSRQRIELRHRIANERASPACRELSATP